MATATVIHARPTAIVAEDTRTEAERLADRLLHSDVRFTYTKEDGSVSERVVSNITLFLRGGLPSYIKGMEVKTGKVKAFAFTGISKLEVL